MENIFGGLIEFPSEQEFDTFITNMDQNSALQVIEKALEFAYQNSTFSIQETYFIYKSLKILKEKSVKK